MEDDEITLEAGANYEEATFRDGCLSLRSSVLAKQQANASPGPKYAIPDGLGRQVLSTFKTTPIVGFAQGDKDKVGRPVERVNARDVPGPMYQLDDITYGRQVDSKRRTAPMPSFGASKRPPLHVGEDCSPGPMTALPRVVDPNEGPSFGGCPWRDKPPAGADTPAPNQYTAPDALGPQLLSTMPSESGFTFGGGNIKRDLAKKGAANEPGPGSYDTLGSTGAKNIRFGTAAQRPPPTNRANDTNPGPNQYEIPSAMGVQVSSRYKTTPLIGFGKPRPKTANSRLPGHDTPAPGQYKVDNEEAAFGFRINSRERSVPGVKFPTGPLRYNDGEEKKNTPGPQNYDPIRIRNAVLQLSNKRAITGVRFGTGPQRYNDLDNEKRPGPQAYDPESIRRGLEASKKRNIIGIRFGQAKNKKERPREGPGPNQYDAPSSMGKQVSSMYKSASAPTFGSGPQRYNDVKKKKGPGPQSYNPSMNNKPQSITNIRFGTGPQRQNERLSSGPRGISKYHLPAALGAQVSSRYKSQPSFSFGAR